MPSIDLQATPVPALLLEKCSKSYKTTQLRLTSLYYLEFISKFSYYEWPALLSFLANRFYCYY